MPSPDPVEFFARTDHPLHRRYEILRAFYLERLTAEEVARRFQIAPSTVYGMTREFRALNDPAAAFFRPEDRRGRPAREVSPALLERILTLRDLQLSVPDIKAQLDAEGIGVLGETAIRRVLRKAGRPRLPRRTRAQRAAAVAAAAAGGNQSRSGRE